jgi:hypothetical protein
VAERSGEGRASMARERGAASPATNRPRPSVETETPSVLCGRNRGGADADERNQRDEQRVLEQVLPRVITHERAQMSNYQVHGSILQSIRSTRLHLYALVQSNGCATAENASVALVVTAVAGGI